MHQTGQHRKPQHASYLGVPFVFALWVSVIIWIWSCDGIYFTLLFVALLISNSVALTKRNNNACGQQLRIFLAIIVNFYVNSDIDFWMLLCAPRDAFSIHSCSMHQLWPFCWFHFSRHLPSPQSFQVPSNIPHSCEDAVLHLQGPHQAWAWWVPLRDPGNWPNRGGHRGPPGAGSLKLVYLWRDLWRALNLQPDSNSNSINEWCSHRGIVNKFL